MVSANQAINFFLHSDDSCQHWVSANFRARQANDRVFPNVNFNVLNRLFANGNIEWLDLNRCQVDQKSQPRVIIRSTNSANINPKLSLIKT